MGNAQTSRRFLSELVGTFALVFIGCGAIVVEQQTGALGHAGVSLAFGLVVMAMIYSVGNVSGAHLNPAVTLGFWFANRLPRADVVVYWLAQFLGGALAGLVLWIMFPAAGDFGVTRPAAGLVPAMITEGVLTFLLMFVILNVSTGHKEKGIMAGVAVGGVVAFAALMGGPVSGASMNPARSLGPALVSLEPHALWLYFLCPALGAVLAGPFCRLIQGDACCSEAYVPEHVDG